MLAGFSLPQSGGIISPLFLIIRPSVSLYKVECFAVCRNASKVTWPAQDSCGTSLQFLKGRDIVFKSPTASTRQKVRPILYSSRHFVRLLKSTFIDRMNSFFAAEPLPSTYINICRGRGSSSHTEQPSHVNKVYILFISLPHPRQNWRGFIVKDWGAFLLSQLIDSG